VTLDAPAPSNSLFQALRVYTSPYKKLRLGKDHDGGYVVCALDGYDCFLSGGIGGDSSFEEEVVRLYPNLVCHAFDGTIEVFPTQHPRISFEQKNVGRINSATETNLHSFLECHTSVLVKMDVEHAEYGWLDSLTTAHLRAIRQLVIEFHPPFSDVTLRRLASHHYLVHLHPNNAIGPTEVDGILVPPLIEATYLRRSDFEQAPSLSSEPIPSALDQPNIPGNPEIRLSGYPYNDVSAPVCPNPRWCRGIMHQLDVTDLNGAPGRVVLSCPRCNTPLGSVFMPVFNQPRTDAVLLHKSAGREGDDLFAGRQLLNVAPGKQCRQSTLSQWSDENGANGAVILSGRDFGIHTELEQNPWWMIDLGEVLKVDLIRIGNRDGARERAFGLFVEVSDDEQSWVNIHENMGWYFGALGDRPLCIRPGKDHFRYLRIGLRGKQYLHLQSVEIFVQAPAEA
jgi:hypothetical protein